MELPVKVTIREMEPADFDIFYLQQLDPEALRMAAFVSKDPRDKIAYLAHREKILRAEGITKKTILAGGQVVGHVSIFPHEGKLEVTYWIGREFWGRGIATQALVEILLIVRERPIFGRAATDNLGSIRVLEKCGFKFIGTDRGFANGRGEEIEECILRLDSLASERL
ncbi:MAG TPA: GNAT family N-acetyltransferase [Opitutaceae bacterium]|jgi:RimJ/RimL family protein N-acetyltransferase|nr:GNAT family N-acetyltransferase [Opitutaceae bacterium]